MRFVVILLFLCVAFALPRGAKLLKKKAPHKTQPVSPSWKNDLTSEEHASLIQLESEIASAKDHHTKKIATRKHHEAAVHMITNKQKQRAVKEWHERNGAHVKKEASYENLPGDIKARLQPDGSQYIVRGDADTTDLYFRIVEGRWEWSPDRSHWRGIAHEIVQGGEWDGESPTQANIDFLNRFHGAQEGLITLGSRKYTEVKWYFRGFLAHSLSGGFWMNYEDGCSSAPHEWVGQYPRAPGVNLRGLSCFATDSRGYSTAWNARARFNTKVVWSRSGVDIRPRVQDNAGNTVTSPYCDYSENYCCADSWMTTDYCGDRTCQERCSSSSMVIDKLTCYDGSSWGSCGASSVLATFHTVGNPSNPCGPPGTPDVDYYGGWTIAIDGHLYGDGALDAMPWYESGVIATNAAGTESAQNLWKRDPDSGATLFDLIGGANRVFHVAANF
jgi:hypothetical protein